MISLRNNQKGVVSFFTVIFVSILLIIMTTAFIRLMINEQQQSTNNDLSSRAFYAAEAGVTDAIVDLRKKLANNEDLGDLELNSCGEEEVLDSEAEISYTCKFVSLEVNQLEGSLNNGETLTLDLVDASEVERLEVSWHSPDDGSPVFGETGSFSLRAGQNIPQTTWLNNNVPAIIRLHSIAFNDNEAGGLRNNIENNITFGYPVGRSGFLGQLRELNVGSNKGPSSNNCSSGAIAGGYACQISFTGLGNKDNKFLRLQAINNRADYRIRTLNSSNQEISIDEQVAIVDVTGKAGEDIFRRVRVFVPITVSGDIDLLPQQTLLIDEGICKEFEVAGNEASDNFGCADTSP